MNEVTENWDEISDKQIYDNIQDGKWKLSDFENYLNYFGEKVFRQGQMDVISSVQQMQTITGLRK